MEWLVGPPKLTVAWEIDDECVRLTKYWFPDVVHRGCFVKDNYDEVASLIQQADPDHKCLILVTAGTPCPDYSVVSAKSEGRNLPEGAKFNPLLWQWVLSWLWVLWVPWSQFCDPG